MRIDWNVKKADDDVFLQWWEIVDGKWVWMRKKEEKPNMIFSF